MQIIHRTSPRLKSRYRLFIYPQIPAFMVKDISVPWERILYKGCSRFLAERTLEVARHRERTAKHLAIIHRNPKYIYYESIKTKTTRRQ